MKTYPYDDPRYDDYAKEWMALYESWNEPIVDRRTLADHLMISPNRVSELVQLGAIQHASKNPLRFGLHHASACYRSYQVWLKYRRPGERYAVG
jgi:hypothetical protein